MTNGIGPSWKTAMIDWLGRRHPIDVILLATVLLGGVSALLGAL